MIPLSADLGSRVSRIVETVMLGCVLAVAVIFWAHTRLQLYKPDILSVGLHRWFLGAFAVFGLLTLKVALRKTSRAFWMAFVIALLAFFYGVRGIRPGGISEPRYKDDVAYTICVEQHPGAHIWVNDVYLGKSPIQIPLKEFHAKVPYWPEPPKGIYDRISQKTMDYRSYSSWGTGHPGEWIAFKVPKTPRSGPSSVSHSVSHEGKEEDREDVLKQRMAEAKKNQHGYYARVRLGDAVGYGSFHGGGGGTVRAEDAIPTTPVTVSSG